MLSREQVQPNVDTMGIGVERQYNVRSGKTDPVQFRGVFKQGPFCL